MDRLELSMYQARSDENRVLLLMHEPLEVGLQPGNIFNACDQTHFWSMHDGGANFLLGDGSVRFVAYSVDSILPALATRNGGEVFSSGDW